MTGDEDREIARCLHVGGGCIDRSGGGASRRRPLDDQESRHQHLRLREPGLWSDRLAGEPAKRASQCGRTIIWGLVRQSPSVWTGGSILDPNDGKTYRLSATYEPDDTLRARIFIGPVFGKTEILKRIDTMSLPGLC